MLALLICVAMSLTSVPLLSPDNEVVDTSVETIIAEGPSYPSHYSTSYDTSIYTPALWVRKNGSDAGFDFPGANVAPSYGMNYFSTDVIQITWDYNFTEIGSSLFPEDCIIYIQVQYDAGYIEAVADLALTDDRIRGVFIDDFQVGLQSPVNMSALYNATHHNDYAFPYDLTLGIIVYNRNYFIQSPYNWTSIEDYIDIIHFWYYPITYPMLYPGLAGYEDDFLTLHSWMPDKEYWMGIYLHYYNIGDYPIEFTTEQLGIAGKIIKMGYASRYSILENFWIQHNPETSILVRDFLSQEYLANWTTTWVYGTQSVSSYVNGLFTVEPSISEIAIYTTHWGSVFTNNYTFYSSHLQELTITGVTGTDYILNNERTGNHQVPIENPDGSIVFLCEPDQTYRIRSMPMTDIVYNGNVYIDTGSPSTATYFYNSNILIRGMLVINTSLICYNSIIRFGNDDFEHPIGEVPDFGIVIALENDADLIVGDCIIEPENRAFPYFFNCTIGTTAPDREVFIASSVIACYSGTFRPHALVDITSTTFFQIQPNGATYYTTLWLECPSYVQEVHVADNLFWNYDTSGKVSIFLMAYNLYTNGHLDIADNNIVGGQYGLWIDMAYSDSGLVIENHSSSAQSSTDYFCEFKVDSASVKDIRITTDTIYDWSVKSTIPGSNVSMYYPSAVNGLYTVTIDATEYSVPVTTGTLDVSFLSPWLPYRNNFTVEPFPTIPRGEDIIGGMVWLLIIFLVPIILNTFVPRIGFAAGMLLMLIVLSATDYTLIPEMILGMFAIAIMFFRSGDTVA
jgi:hypothetical protein